MFIGSKLVISISPLSVSFQQCSILPDHFTQPLHITLFSQFLFSDICVCVCVCVLLIVPTNICLYGNMSSHQKPCGWQRSLSSPSYPVFTASLRDTRLEAVGLTRVLRPREVVASLRAPKPKLGGFPSREPDTVDSRMSSLEEE